MLLMNINFFAITNILAVRIVTIVLFQGIRIILPILLLLKAVVNLGKVENIKNNKEFSEAKKEFIESLIKATIIFMVLTFIQFGINLLAENSSAQSIWSCIKNLIIF